VKELLVNRLTVTWSALVILTLLSFTVLQGFQPYQLAGAAVIVVAFVKARLVGLEFMELRKAPLVLRLMFETWIVLICSTIVAVSMQSVSVSHA